MQHPAAVAVRHFYSGNGGMAAGQTQRRLQQADDAQFGIFIFH